MDLGASISFIDEEIVEGLGLEVHPFICDVPQCVSFEGTTLTKSVLNVIGWVEIRIRHSRSRTPYHQVMGSKINV